MKETTKKQRRPEVGSPEYKQKVIVQVTRALERTEKAVIRTEKRLIKFKNESNPHTNDIEKILELTKAQQEILAKLLADKLAEK